MKVHSCNILIYRLGSLGDTIMALPCFHQVRSKYPDADITLLTNIPIGAKAAPIETVLGSNYFFNRVLAYPLGTRNLLTLTKLAHKIRSHKIETVINLTAARTPQAMIRDRLFFRACGVNNLIGFPSLVEDFEVAIDHTTGDYEWEANRLARRIRLLGSADLSDNQYWDLRLTLAERQKAEECLQKVLDTSPLLAISVGTKMQAKDWGETNWTSLIRKLSRSIPDWTIVMVGAADERDLGDRCLQEWSGKSINLCGQVTPRVSAAVLQQARLFIGHDSGPMHLAACVGTPCVAVFSAQNLPRQWYPRGNRNTILYHRTDCAGCRLNTCIEQKKKCILSITVDEVEQAVMHLLTEM